MNDDIKTQKWWDDHDRIAEYFAEYLLKHKKAPNKTQAAQDLGIGRTYLHEHIKQIDFGRLITEKRVFTPRVLDSVAQTAIKGNAASQKLWMQVVEQVDLADPKGKGGDKIEIHVHTAGDENKPDS